MSTLHACAGAAIRRDLERARIVLTQDVRLLGERRRALTDHLVWLATLTDSTVPAVRVAAADLTRQATIFATSGDRRSREELVTAVGTLLGASRVGSTRSLEHWTSDRAVSELGEHVAWLVDGLVMPPGQGLFLRDQPSPENARVRARAYRRMRALLWGTMSLSEARRPIFS